MLQFIITFIFSIIVTGFSIGHMIDHGAKSVYFSIKCEQSYYWNPTKYVLWITMVWTITLITLLSNLNLI